MNEWYEKMNAVCSTARYFANRNVIDVEFQDGSQLEVYVAISQIERQRGLSEVAFIDLDGMLFAYSLPSLVPFTMKAMLMDLDIAWYSADGSVLKFGTYKAGDKTPLCCPLPFSYVLEAPADTLTRSNLKVSKT
jgi:uncharacterized membrane protein (UPF0127 family)